MVFFKKCMSRFKRSSFLNWLVFLIGLGLVWSLIKGLLQAKRAYLRVDEAEIMMKEEKERHDELLAELEEIQTEEYTERVVRNDLNMQKEGEIVVVISEKGEENTEEQRGEDKEKKNWKRWRDLVF